MRGVYGRINKEIFHANLDDPNSLYRINEHKIGCYKNVTTSQDTNVS